MSFFNILRYYLSFSYCLYTETSTLRLAIKIGPPFHPSKVSNLRFRKRTFFYTILQEFRPCDFKMWQKESQLRSRILVWLFVGLQNYMQFPLRWKIGVQKNFAPFECVNDLWSNSLEPGVVLNNWNYNLKKAIELLDKPEHKRIYTNILKYFISSTKQSLSNKFHVIVHGVAWMNNILLKMDKVNIWLQ